MNYDLKQILDWKDYYCSLYEKTHPKKIYRTTLRYVGIDENLKATELSTSPLVFQNSVYGVVFLEYTYIKQTQDDNSFFALFISEGKANDYIEENGWKMKFDKPIVEFNKTNGRCLLLSKSDLNIEIKFLDWDYTNVCWKIESQMGNCFKLFKMAQQCTTQQELNFLLEMFHKDKKIECLNQKLLKEQMNLYYKEETIKGYKEMLDEIKALIENK